MTSLAPKETIPFLFCCQFNISQFKTHTYSKKFTRQVVHVQNVDIKRGFINSTVTVMRFCSLDNVLTVTIINNLNCYN